MPLRDVLSFLQRRPQDPNVGWLTAERLQEAVQQIYHDMADAGALVEQIPTMIRRHVEEIPNLPVDTWAVVHHSLDSEHVVVQAYQGREVVPVRVKILGSDAITVQPVNPPTGVLTVVIVG